MDSTFGILTFLVALVFGFLAWVSKHVWRDRKRTQTFAMVAIVSTIGFMTWALFYSGL